MADKILFDETAFKHGYTEDDILCGIETNIYDGSLIGESGKYAIIGFDSVANPIEIFYNIIDDETIKVFHCMELRKKIAVQMKAKE